MVLTLVLFTVGIQFDSADLTYGQIPSDVNITDPNALSPVDEVLQYCNEHGMKGDIKGDLVETGKVGTMYRDMTCEDVKQLGERLDRIGNAFKDLEALSEMDK
jgi:hypothetical protein